MPASNKTPTTPKSSRPKKTKRKTKTTGAKVRQESAKAAATTTFISYANQDSDYVLQFAKTLQAAGIKTWMAPNDIEGGEDWAQAIERAILESDNVVVVCSPFSVSSPEVMAEVNLALEREGKLLLPIIIKECELPYRWKRSQWYDFTKDYQNAMSKTIVALKPGVKPVFDMRPWWRKFFDVSSPLGKLRIAVASLSLAFVAALVFGIVSVRQIPVVNKVFAEFNEPGWYTEIVMDLSSDMLDSLGQELKLDIAQTVVRNEFDKRAYQRHVQLTTFAGCGGTDVQIAFGDTVSNVDSLFGSLEPRGQTSLVAGVSSALARLARADSATYKRLVVLAGGTDDCLPQGENAASQIAAELERLNLAGESIDEVEFAFLVLGESDGIVMESVRSIARVVIGATDDVYNVSSEQRAVSLRYLFDFPLFYQEYRLLTANLDTVLVHLEERFIENFDDDREIAKSYLADSEKRLADPVFDKSCTRTEFSMELDDLAAAEGGGGAVEEAAAFNDVFDLACARHSLLNQLLSLGRAMIAAGTTSAHSSQWNDALDDYDDNVARVPPLLRNVWPTRD